MTTTNKTAVQQAVRDAIFTAFPKEVVKMPLCGPDNLPSPHYGLCFEDATSRGDWCSATVKQGYEPHTREDVAVICETIAAGLDVPLADIDISAAWKNGKGHRVAVQPTKAYRRSVASGDTIWPKFIVRANYGGSFIASVGMYRDLCSNMQMMRRVENTTVYLRHVGSFRDNFDATVEEWQYLAAKFDNIVECATKLRESTVAVEEFYDRLYPQPETNASQTRHRNKLSAMFGRMVKERKQLGYSLADATDHKKANLWELVNSVTGWVQHSKRQTRNGQRLSDAAKAFAAVDDKECHGAFDLANEMMVAA